ncbi:MAG TPA: hypothetical protein GX401_09650 [Clostridiales bacterium]|nr:hypothetical protein [Clostridiales bacterium]
MKCIYCNSEAELTSSDIITYAITGAKLTKSFVCKTHNALTNDNYEKKFVADLDFFRNHLGLTTRDGKLIQYKADISVDGTEMHNVKISNRESLFAPKGVVAGADNEGKKILMAPMEKLEKISKGKASTVDISDVTLHKTISSDSFLGFYAVHSIAKMAYEWYCYVNDIEEFQEENREIVDYILGKNENNPVDILIDGNYYAAIDQLSELGTNALFQYDDIDGYQYVVFDFWKTISYRVRICKSLKKIACDTKALFFELYLYHIDGSKSTTAFGAYSLNNNKKPAFYTVQPQNITVGLWREFVKRIEKIMSTMILSIHTLKREIDVLSSKLKKYDEGKIDMARLLGFEENNIVTVIEIINQLYVNKDKYDASKSFNANLPIILNLNSDTITRTQEDKTTFLMHIMEMDRNKELSDYIRNGIGAFYDIYDQEMDLTK